MTTTTTTTYEFRVTWRRASWSATTCSKSRIFAREHDARRFLAKLHGDGRPDLAAPVITVARRPVGRWSE